MIRFVYNYLFVLVGLLMVYAFSACTDSDLNAGKDYVVRIGDRVLTVSEFNKAFEVVKAAYPHNVMQDSVALREGRIRLLNQMTEQMLIQERAKELGIEISDSEVERAVLEIRADYPQDVFEQTLLEHAISYHSWKEGLKNRLLVDKVVSEELGEQIIITHDEISEYYEQHYKGEILPSDVENETKNINEIIIKSLRRKKLEEAYKPWIKNLQKRYTIEINKTQIEKIASSQTLSEQS
jgi:hypothetical protein